mgnify:CR=1 FL=1
MMTFCVLVLCLLSLVLYLYTVLLLCWRPFRRLASSSVRGNSADFDAVLKAKKNTQHRRRSQFPECQMEERSKSMYVRLSVRHLDNEVFPTSVALDRMRSRLKTEGTSKQTKRLIDSNSILPLHLHNMAR